MSDDHQPRPARPSGSKLRTILGGLSLLPERLSDPVIVELIDLMFAPLLPAIFIGVVELVIGSIIAFRNDDISLFVLSLIGLLVTGARVLVTVFYHRRAKLSPLTLAAAKQWEFGYGAASLAFAIQLGVMANLALRLHDTLVPMLITSIVFGYAAGIITRLAVRPVVCAGCLLAAATPELMGFADHISLTGSTYNNTAYSIQMAVLGFFTLVGLKTISHSYQATLRQLLAKQDLVVLAGQDALTGLPNRFTLRSRFSDGAVSVSRSGAFQAVHCLDLDHFKAVNDLNGHPIGDSLLRIMSERLTRTLQDGDTASRVGGDEFIVLQPGIHHEDEALLLARRMIRVISAPYVIDGLTIEIGVSIGIAIAPEDGFDLNQLISRADEALYRAKRGNRGGVIFWHDKLLPSAEVQLSR
jgi:diguanylate cyclase (GGDEF)-like protein